MKYDGSRPMTRGAKRTLTAFSNGMLLLLTKSRLRKLPWENSVREHNTRAQHFITTLMTSMICWSIAGRRLRHKLGFRSITMHRKTKCSTSILTGSMILHGKTGVRSRRSCFITRRTDIWFRTDAGDFSKVYGCCRKGDPQGTACRPLQQYAFSGVAVVGSERCFLHERNRKNVSADAFEQDRVMDDSLPFRRRKSVVE